MEPTGSSARLPLRFSSGATTTRDDLWYKPYDHASDYKQHARDYLAWEVALIDQVKRDPTIRFRRTEEHGPTCGSGWPTVGQES